MVASSILGVRVMKEIDEWESRGSAYICWLPSWISSVFLYIVVSKSTADGTGALLRRGMDSQGMNCIRQIGQAMASGPIWPGTNSKSSTD